MSSSRWSGEDSNFVRRVKALYERGFVGKGEAVQILKTLTGKKQPDVEHQFAIMPHDRSLDTCRILADVVAPLLSNYSDSYKADVLNRWFRKLDEG